MSQFDDDVELLDRVEVKKPKYYKVLMLNDHYSTMDFVVRVLKDVFHKPHQEAYDIMLDVHRKGAGLCGVYTYEIAETKIKQVHDKAKAEGHPLRCVMSEE